MPDVRFRIVAEFDASAIRAEVNRLQAELAALGSGATLPARGTAEAANVQRQSLLAAQGARAQQLLLAQQGLRPSQVAPELQQVINSARQSYIRTRDANLTVAQASANFSNQIALAGQSLVDTYVKGQQRLSTAAKLQPASIQDVAVARQSLAQEIAIDRKRLQILEATAVNEQGLYNLRAQSVLTARRIAAAEHQLEQRIIAEAVQRGDVPRGTRFQQFQAGIAARAGGLGGVRLPTEFPQLGQVVRGSLLTTARFAASGALLYGGVQFLSEMIREGSQLQETFAIIQGQIQSLGPASGVSFGQVRQEILETANATGVMATEVAHIQRQLAGAFADEQGAPNFDRAATETRAALELARVTGLPTQEITDSLTAVSLSFDRSFREIGDTIVGLEQQFGVLAPEIVAFTADLAPLGAALGFTAEQLSGLGAVAQRASGRSGAVIAEQLGRALPSLQQNATQLIQLFAGSDAASLTGPLTEAFADNDIPRVVALLAEAYDDLSESQKNQLGSLVGGRREAATFFALLEQGTQTIRVLSGEIDLSFTGATERRFEEISKTVGFTFDRLQRSIEEFGIILFESGLGDGLVLIGKSLTVVFEAAGKVLQAFSSMNDALGGLPAKVATLALALNGLVKVLGMVGATAGVSAALRGVPAGLAGGAALGYGKALPLGSTLYAGAAPVAGTLAAGGLGALATRGASFARAHPAAIAVLAGVTAFALREKAGNDIEEASEFLSQQTAEALRSGARTPEEAREIARRYAGDVSLTARFGQIFSGKKSLIDLVEAEIEAFEKETVLAQLKAAGLGVVAENYAGPDSDYSPELVQDLLDAAVRENPELQSTLDLIAERIEAERALQREIDEAGKAAAKELLDPEKLRNLASLEADYAAGRGNAEELIAEYRRRLALIRDTIETFRSRGDSGIEALVEAYKEEADLINRISEVLVSSVLDPIDLRQRIREAAGTPGGATTTAEELTSVLDELEDAPAQQLEAVFRGIDLLRQAAEEAEQTSFEIPDEWRRILIGAQVRTDPQFRQLAGLLGVTVDQLAEQVANGIVDFGQSVRDIGLALIEARRKILLAKIALASAESEFGAGARTRSAREELAELEEQEAYLNNLPPIVDPGGTLPTSPGTAEEEDNLQQRIAEARLAVARARAQGDPVKLAQIDIQAADLARQFAKDDAEVLQALAQRIEAEAALRAAIADIATAQSELTAALNPNNAVRRTYAEFHEADVAVHRATDEASRLRALAARATALKAHRDAVHDVLRAQRELLIAIADAAGDTVRAAELGLKQALDDLARLRRSGGGKAEIARAQAEVVRQRANLRDTELSERERAIDVALQLERITVSQAIRQLEALLQIPNLTKEQTDNILLKIKQLKDSVSGDLQFNISDIELPTIYEVRRLREAGELTATGGYQDSRVISLQVNISSEVDAGPVLDQLASIVGSPPISGTVPRNY